MKLRFTISILLFVAVVLFSAELKAQEPPPAAMPAAVQPPADTSPASKSESPPQEPQQPSAAPDSSTAPAANAPPSESPAAEPPATPSIPSYHYAWSDCEYGVMFPEAPRVRTIWDTDQLSKRYAKPDILGQIGEVANYERVNIATKDSIAINLTCMKTTREFLYALTPEKMYSTLGAEFKGKTMQGFKKNYSKGKDTLSWATIAGYGFDKDKKTVFRVGHYLTGLTTIMIMTIEVSAENKDFMTLYDMVDKSISLNKN